VVALCGHRPDTGKPNISDGSNAQSVLIAERFFDRAGVASDAVAPKDAGRDLSKFVRTALQEARPDLAVDSERHPKQFVQYAHLAGAERALEGKGPQAGQVLKELGRRLSAVDVASAVSPSVHAELLELVGQATVLAERRSVEVNTVLMQTARHSLLGLDVVVARPAPPTAVDDHDITEELLLGVSCKWTLRTDRGQDAVAQGDRLASHRRGPMPRYGVVTMECRPYYLTIVAEGSSGVDAVYHPALPQVFDALQSVLDDPPSWQNPKSRRAIESYIETLRRLVSNRRVRPFEDLVNLVAELPHGSGALG
jgi:hypothetical protein